VNEAPRVIALVALVVWLAAGCRRTAQRADTSGAGGHQLSVAPPTEVPPGRSFVVAAAGDIAGRMNRQGESAALLLGLHQRERLAAILPLGDLVYPRGEYHDFLAYYAPSWGHPTLRPLTRPVPGNHEYDQGRSDADGYFDYWNGPGQRFGQGGERGLGYYSYDLGDWHMVAINSSDQCRKIPCTPGSLLHSWLVQDLRASRKRCQLAYWHHPRFQVGAHRDAPRVQPLWEALYDAGADVVLTGHDHNFQQLAPLDRAGRPEPGRGIRSFVVGTGGASPYVNFTPDDHPGAVERLITQRVGVLVLTLEPDAYAWRFVAVASGGQAQVLAEGRDVCH
jgi:acid phosphatase type 7